MTSTAQSQASGDSAKTPAVTKEDLQKQTQELKKNVQGFMSDVTFGVGRVWEKTSQQNPASLYFFEFFGSLLTGILISIGAPYWHDLLRALADMRKS